MLVAICRKGELLPDRDPSAANPDAQLTMMKHGEVMSVNCQDSSADGPWAVYVSVDLAMQLIICIL